MKTSTTVLLTGATGVVGSALVPALLQRGIRVIALIRANPIADPRVIAVEGDISVPGFGLDLAELQREHGSIDCVVHSAALTHFGKSEEQMQRANVLGTVHAIEVANTLDARLLYVSTAYTHDLKLPEYLKEYSTYCESKRRAELQVKTLARDWTIVRPSIVVGDSATGAISRFQGLHSIVGAVLQGFAPVIPAKDGALVDLVPQDVLAEAIAALSERNGRHREYWITRGTQASKVADVHQLMDRFSQSCGYTRPMPKIVDPEIIDRLFIPVFLPSLPEFARRRLNALVDHACYFNMSEPFPSNYAELAEEFSLPAMPDDEYVILNNMAYWAEQTRYRERAA
ncbi:thioester reductase-like protein [Tahibacter aquaticus]|uniref:Thioester reductase-like protein n=1 Tax=Tahibacter aquaticus TaxID=520092 RepID=A0A4R6Z210_9GAMM|nr:SDR family oxidoreductase [Tahibacter aquaticus]TDR45628.1 thioester reductase-like protein [Tahibacter aquaticus]